MEIMMRGEVIQNIAEMRYLNVYIRQRRNVHIMLSMNLRMIGVTIEIIIIMMREQDWSTKIYRDPRHLKQRKCLFIRTKGWKGLVSQNYTIFNKTSTFFYSHGFNCIAILL